MMAIIFKTLPTAIAYNRRAVSARQCWSDE
jgi:hypothetical protein